jgi:cyclopropane fatty-acyl-phospholipid synthase-like methyltransferase
LYDKDYFLTACEGHEEFLKSQGELLSRRLSEAFAVASVEPGMRVLDVGCGRGEILRHCARLGANAYGIDYAEVAVDLSQDLIQSAGGSPVSGSAAKMAVYQADAKRLPFPSAAFDRVLMFDVVEHLHPWELDAAMAEVRRVLRPGGMYVVHTAPNRWYDAYAYPVVRLIRTWQGKGKLYPQDPRALNVAVNQDVHVNEQDMVSLRRNLARAGFGKIKVWLATPPQHRREPLLFQAARHVAFHWPPFRWFFEREVFGVGVK